MAPGESSSPAPPKPRRGGGGLTVSLTDARGRRARAPGLASWVCRTAPRSARGTVCVAIVSDARVRALNRRYRGTDYTTDVLSFPNTTSDSARPRGTAASCSYYTAGAKAYATGTGFLGDIVIARGVAERQARAMGHSAAFELRVLALHGLLHLLGYDHERDRGRMRRLERRLLRRAGLREGLIERAYS